MDKKFNTKIERIISKIDKNMKKSDTGWDAAKVCLASAFLGADEKKISDKLGMPVKEVSKYGKNLCKCGVWKKGKVHCD